MKKSLAIIGTGIAGMSAAYFLKEDFHITFFEKDNYAGGHTNTYIHKEDERNVYIDTAFMVYNEITYPNLTRFFKELDIKTKPTKMTFSVQHIPSGLEYCGTGINGLFAQRTNIFCPRFIKMLMDMDRFNKKAPGILDKEAYVDLTLEQYVKDNKFGNDFLYKFLIPMSSAVWSTPPDLMLKFPAVTLIRFFKNHGFLGLDTHYQWRTPEGGSRQYRDKLMNAFNNTVHINNGAKEIFEEEQNVVVIDTRGERHEFDKVLIAAHADDALKMLKKPTDLQRNLLSKFRYQPNRATLHTDKKLMPKTRRAWSSWNYRIQRDRRNKLTTTTIYDMNSLQDVSDKQNYFVSINDPGEINPLSIIWEKEYHHPLFDVSAMRAQAKLPELNREGNIYFSGSYFKYGFHEDAFTSGLNAAREIAGKVLWN